MCRQKRAAETQLTQLHVCIIYLRLDQMVTPTTSSASLRDLLTLQHQAVDFGLDCSLLHRTTLLISHKEGKIG